ncbi:MAG TPA: metalloregulator ArsR/SmtB family transcription factor, partial [Armatimonadota bacterium]|nr:metalloregulator ArsR/SmtB family transcription factor [Armatimonadota bacterium]
MAEPAIFRQMATVSDAMRARILRLLARHELTVSELCAVLQIPQSTVSRHLRLLADDDWVLFRRDGTSRLHSMVPAELTPEMRGLWEILREQVEGTPAAAQDDRRAHRPRELVEREVVPPDVPLGDDLALRSHAGRIGG